MAPPGPPNKTLATDLRTNTFWRKSQSVHSEKYFSIIAIKLYCNQDHWWGAKPIGGGGGAGPPPGPNDSYGPECSKI